MTEPFGNNSAERLRSLIERIEKREEERRNLAADIKDIYAEAKGAGFNTKVLRAIVRDRRRDAEDVEEERNLWDLYMQVLS